MTEQQMKAVTVEELFSGGKISRKTYSTLLKARLRNAFDLKRYQSGLSRLFKTGATGIKEINALLAELESADKLPEVPVTLFPPEPQISKGEALLEKLSGEQLQMMDIVYKNMIDKMLKTHERNTTRVANVLKPMSVATFIRDFLLEDDERILMLSDVGEASLPQLTLIKKALNDAVEGFADENVPVSFKILALHAGGLLDNDEFVLEYFKQNMRLPVVYLVQKAVIQNKSQQMFMAFLQRYDIFQGAVEIDMTKIEKTSFTISTYSNTVYDALFTYGASTEIFGEFVSELMADTVNTAYLMSFIEGDFVPEDDGQVANIIKEENLVMEPKCVLAVIGKILSDKYNVLGGYTRNMGKAIEGRWKNCYLLAKELTDGFDTEKELWLFRDNVVKMSTERYLLDINEYLDNREEVLQQNLNVERLALPFKNIVTAEIELETDENGMIVIPKKRDKALADRLYIILSAKKQPMLLDELTAEINSGDGRRYVRASVSLALNKDKRFQGSGKKGYYALSEWQLPFFGSNADIVKEVLEDAELPMKAEQIVAILKEYPYNKQFSKGDLSSVVLLGKNIFTKFQNGYVGLNDKDYPAEFVRKDVAELEKTEVKNETAPQMPINNEGDEGFHHEVAPEDETPTVETPTVETPTVETPTVETPTEETPTEETPTEETPTVETPTEEITIEEKPAEDAPEEEIPIEEKPAEDAPEEDAPAEEKTIEDAPAEEKPVEDATTEEICNQKTEPLPQPQPVTVKNAANEEWLDSMQFVWNFVHDNGREPLEMFTAEVKMAQWLSVQKQAMRQNVLPVEQKDELLKLRDYLW